LCTFGLCIFFIKHRVYCHVLGTTAAVFLYKQFQWMTEG
jgi:hypothetical protein